MGLSYARSGGSAGWEFGDGRGASAAEITAACLDDRRGVAHANIEPAPLACARRFDREDVLKPQFLDQPRGERRGFHRAAREGQAATGPVSEVAQITGFGRRRAFRGI